MQVGQFSNRVEEFVCDMPLLAHRGAHSSTRRQSVVPSIMLPSFFAIAFKKNDVRVRKCEGVPPSFFQNTIHYKLNSVSVWRELTPAETGSREFVELIQVMRIITINDVKPRHMHMHTSARSISYTTIAHLWFI